MIALAQATDNADTWMFDSTADLPPGIANRTVLQGQVVWSGLQDGYAAAGASDTASPYAQLWWNLGPVKTQHCNDCPEVAMGSPYDPPWAAAGSNQLTQSPGDGQTECGAGCNCGLSYEYPDASALAELGQAIQDKWNDWYPSGIDAEGNVVLTQPIMPPGAGSVLSDAQKGALDNFRNSSDMWDTVRRNLPPMPSFFGTEDLPSPLPAWEDLTAAQQAVVQRVEDAHEQWLNAAGLLVPPPIILPDPATEMRKWLAQASTGAFTPWWNEMDVTPSQESEIEAWLNAVGRGEVVDWPTPQQPEEYDAMQKWLEWASENLDQQIEDTEIDTDFRAREVQQPVIKLYNPNHDSKGRFTYGSGATSTVAKGQGATRREGDKRVSNANAGKTKGYQITDTNGESRAALNRMVGRELTDDEIGGLVGAQKGDSVSLYATGLEGDSDRGISFTLASANRGDYHAMRTLSQDEHGNLVLENESFSVAAGVQGQGIGARVFGTQVETASALGVDHITVDAVGGPRWTPANGLPNLNGYYTWARFGYQAKLSDISSFNPARLPAGLRGAKTMQGLMRLAGGAQWWKANGVVWRGTFSLRSGSVSRRAWSHYKKEKGIKLSELPTGDQIDFTDEDEEIMERFWTTLPADIPDDPTGEDEVAK